MLPGRDGTPSLSRKSKSTPPLTCVRGLVDLSQSIVIVCRVEIIENFFNFVLKFVYICPTRGKDGPRVFIILVIITTCYISNISRISLFWRNSFFLFLFTFFHPFFNYVEPIVLKTGPYWLVQPIQWGIRS